MKPGQGSKTAELVCRGRAVALAVVGGVAVVLVGYPAVKVRWARRAVTRLCDAYAANGR